MRNIFRSTVFLAIIATFLWSTAFAGVKIGLQYHTPLQFGGLRFIIAGVMVAVVFGKWDQFLAAIKNEWRFIMLIAFIQTIVQYGMFYTGMNLVPGALGAMIVGSGPLFVAVVAHFTIPDDRLTMWKMVSFLTGVAGIIIITLGRQAVDVRGNLEWAGIVLLILNNVAAGYSNVLVAKTKKPISPIILTSLSLFSGGLALYLISLPIEGFHYGPFPAEYYISLFWLAFLSASAFSIWYTLLKRPGVKVSELNIWKFLIPVSGAALSWLLVKGEHPDAWSLTGMVVIALALILMNLPARKKKSLNP